MSLPGTLLNGGIVQHGTTSHQNSGVTPGIYTSPMTVTVDSTGVLTAAYKVWQAAITYSNSDLAVGSDSQVYISQQTGNLNHDPITDDGTWWKLLRTWVLESLTAGAGLTKTGNSVDWNPDNTTLEVNTDIARIKDLGVTSAKLAASAVTLSKMGVPPGFYVDFFSGMTPSASGADTFEFIVPPAPDGSSATYTFVQVKFRLGSSGSAGTNPTVKVQKSTAAGTFSASDIHTALSVTGGSATLEASTTTFSVATCQTGDKLRANVTVLGTGNSGWMLALFATRTA